MTMDANASMTEEYIQGLIKEALIYALPEWADAADTLSFDVGVETLGIASVSALEMAGYIESRLGIQFADDELVRIDKLQDLSDLILKHAQRHGIVEKPAVNLMPHAAAG